MLLDPLLLIVLAGLAAASLVYLGLPIKPTFRLVYRLYRRPRL